MAIRIHSRDSGTGVLVSALLVLLIYTTGSLQGFLHSGSPYHFHSEEGHSCAAAAEVDPCHIALYHGGTPECSHDTHLFASVHDCDLCDLLPNFKVRDWAQVRMADPVVVRPFFYVLPELRESDPGVPGIQLRGPPALV